MSLSLGHCIAGTSLCLYVWTIDINIHVQDLSFAVRWSRGTEAEVEFSALSRGRLIIVAVPWVMGTDEHTYSALVVGSQLMAHSIWSRICEQCCTRLILGSSSFRQSQQHHHHLCISSTFTNPPSLSCTRLLAFKFNKSGYYNSRHNHFHCFNRLNFTAFCSNLQLLQVVQFRQSLVRVVPLNLSIELHLNYPCHPPLPHYVA